MRSPSRSTRLAAAGLALAAIVSAACSDATADDVLDPTPVEEPADPDTEPDPADDATDDDATDDDDTAAPPAAPTTPTPPTPPTRPAPPGDSATPTATPVATSPLKDGAYEGRLVQLDRRFVTLDLVRILSGDEAIAAAKEAGALDADGTLPNDVYVQDLDQQVTLPVAGDGGFQILDCTEGCALVGTTLDQLASGQATPYGGAHAMFRVTVDGGQVVSLVEQYLP